MRSSCTLNQLTGRGEKMYKEYPQLFGLSRVGKVKQWQPRVTLNQDKTACLIIATGYVGGKIRDIEKHIKKGKNIGK